MILEGELLISLLPVDKAQEIAINKATDMITGDWRKAVGKQKNYWQSNKAGLNFANNVSKMVDEALLSEETKQLPPKKSFLRRMIPFM